MRFELSSPPPSLTSGSLASMIDIVFLLIIFFVVTASFDREQIDADVNLPAIDAAAVKTLPPQRLMVNVFADGSVKIGFTILKPEETQEKLSGLLGTLRTEEKTVLVVSGDRETPHKHISNVMNAAALAGFSQVRINAEVKEKE